MTEDNKNTQNKPVKAKKPTKRQKVEYKTKYGTPAEKMKLVEEVLKPYFIMDYSVEEACTMIGIPSTTVKTWLSTNLEMRLKIEGWRNMVRAKARRNVTGLILGKDAPEEFNVNAGDIALSTWWLRGKEKNVWSERQELLTANLTHEEILAMQDENIKKAKEIIDGRASKQKKGLYDKIKSKRRTSS